MVEYTLKITNFVLRERERERGIVCVYRKYMGFFIIKKFIAFFFYIYINFVYTRLCLRK